MAAPAEIVRLVETFERNKETYRQGELNETQLRREFLEVLCESKCHAQRS